MFAGRRRGRAVQRVPARLQPAVDLDTGQVRPSGARNHLRKRRGNVYIAWFSRMARFSVDRRRLVPGLGLVVEFTFEDEVWNTGG